MPPEPTPEPGQGTPVPPEFGPTGEATVAGRRWFDLDLAVRDYPWRPGQMVVASAAIDLAAEGLLAPRQLVYHPDPVTRLCLTVSTAGQLDFFTWGDCEFLESPGGILRALGHAALAAGTVSAPQWETFAADAELD